MVAIVGVEDRQVLAIVDERDQSVERGVGTGVGLKEDLDARFHPGHLAGNVRGGRGRRVGHHRAEAAVGGAVVEDDDAVGRTGLGAQGSHRRADVSLVVVERDEDGDFQARKGDGGRTGSPCGKTPFAGKQKTLWPR